MDYKYLVLFPIPEPVCSVLERLMDEVEQYTHIPPPYKKLCPHVTFHRPIVGIAEGKLLNMARSIALQARQTRVTVSRLDHFGDRYIVLPVHATRSVASLWVGITNLLAILPEYEHGQFDHDNTLHITVAETTKPVFDEVWTRVRNLSPGKVDIPMRNLEIHRKPVSGGAWERVDRFGIPY